MHSTKVSLEEIYRGLSSRFATIRNLTIKTSLREEIVNGRKPTGPTDLGDKQLGYEWMRAEYRISNNKRYVRYELPMQELARKPGRKPIDIRHLSWNGTVGMHFEESFGTGGIADQLENPVLGNKVLSYLDWAVSEVDLRGKDHAFLPSSIKRPETRLVPGIETVNGYECHVVEVPGIDRLWIDVSKGYALVKRELRFAAGGPLRRATVANGWVEATKGVWLPKRIVREFYCGLDHPRGHWNTVATRVTLDAEYESKPLADDAFTITFPPGTYVGDGIHGNIYRQPGASGDPFDDAVQTALRMHQNPLPAPRGALVVRFTIVTVLFVLLVFGLRRLSALRPPGAQ